MEKWRIKLSVELIAWLMTGLLLILFILPITRKIYQYPYIGTNIIFIIVTVTLVRYTFLLKHTFLARIQWLKALLILASVPAFLYILRLFKDFQEFLSERGVESIMLHLPHVQQLRLGKYITAEMLFFGSASMICIILFAFRMLISIWRQHNKDTV